MSEPTAYPELDEVLAGLVDATRGILGRCFVGAYLQGSFALGAGDLASDCDFLVVTDRAVTGEEYAELAALHAELPTRPGHWTRHLEGSYPVLDELRGLDAVGRPWPFIDHGSRELARDPHCNTEVTRWILHEHGITVPARALRSRMDTELPGLLAGLESWIRWDVAWCQRYVVIAFCRVLATRATGRVLSKPAALAWAAAELDGRWRPLLEQVYADRAPFDADERPRPGSVAETLAFAAYCVGRDAREG
jgi:aminoglycoside adenylyltransferase-like protein